jgi:hypothetical protein
MEDKEQLSFLKQVQIRNRIYIKNPRSKTAFEFGPKLLEVQTRLEKSDKFPKFLIWIDLPDWHHCMAKIEASIEALHRLGLKEKGKRFDFEYKLNQVHFLLIPRNYKMKHCRLQSNDYSEN